MNDIKENEIEKYIDKWIKFRDEHYGTVVIILLIIVMIFGIVIGTG